MSSQDASGLTFGAFLFLGAGIAVFFGSDGEANSWIGGVLIVLGLLCIGGLIKALNEADYKERGKLGRVIASAGLSSLSMLAGVILFFGIGIKANSFVGVALFIFGVYVAGGFSQLEEKEELQDRANSDLLVAEGGSQLEVQDHANSNLEDELESSWSQNGGKVYLLKRGEYYKIGVTSGPISSRVRALQTGSPHPIEPVLFVFTPDPYGLEAKLHNEYARQRVQGEWFKLRDADVELIKRVMIEEERSWR